MTGFEFQVLRWEIRHFYEKDENFNFVLVSGKKVSIDSWAVLTVMMGRREAFIEMETKDFEAHVLPKVLDPLIRFWREVSVGHSLFAKRESMLAWLLEQKAQYPDLCEP